jgi:regulator of nucleoside diphosphate kinase
MNRLRALCERPATPGARLLARELGRAIVVGPAEAPRDFVRLDSTVAYRDLLTGRRRTVQVVAPPATDRGARGVSVTSPAGAGLLGLRPGDLFAVSTEDGRPQVLEILEVRQAHGEAAAHVS